MSEFDTRSLCRDMHHDSDAHRSGVDDVKLTRTDQRNITETSVTSRRSWKGRMEIIRSGEQHTDDVLMVDAVAIDHLLEERDRPLLDLIDGINVDGGGASQGPDRCVHEC